MESDIIPWLLLEHIKFLNLISLFHEKIKLNSTNWGKYEEEEEEEEEGKGAFPLYPSPLFWFCSQTSKS